MATTDEHLSVIIDDLNDPFGHFPALSPLASVHCAALFSLMCWDPAEQEHSMKAHFSHFLSPQPKEVGEWTGSSCTARDEAKRTHPLA